jgi:tetratricopeptide (TPR) repeat protein
MYEEALEHYLEAETAEKDNMHTVAMIGHCYLDLKRYDDALKYYFRVEYHDPGNYRVLKPIAWCYFVAGKFEDSRKYYNKLSDENLKAHDYINIGHLALCTGERDQAVASYRRSITKGNLPGEELIEIFREDSALLASLGADPDDLPIIADFLIYDAGLTE